MITLATQFRLPTVCANQPRSEVSSHPRFLGGLCAFPFVNKNSRFGLCTRTALARASPESGAASQSGPVSLGKLRSFPSQRHIRRRRGRQRLNYWSIWRRAQRRVYFRCIYAVIYPHMHTYSDIYSLKKAPRTPWENWFCSSESAGGGSQSSSK